MKAAFFVVGLQALRYPELIREIYQLGHEIGNHSWSHEMLVFRNIHFVRDEIQNTDNLLVKLGYENQIYFRAPSGRKFIILPWLLYRMQKKHILFDVVAKDWEQPPTETMLKRVIDHTKPGSIILLHDGGGRRENTVILTEKIIKHFRKQDTGSSPSLN